MLTQQLNTLGGIGVERIDLHQLYMVGGDLHPFLDLSARDANAAELFFALMRASVAVDKLLGQDSPMRLDFCRPDAVTLKLELAQLRDQCFTDAATGAFSFPTDTNQQVPGWRMHSARAALITFEAVFRTEMQRAATYVVPKRGTYDLGDLVDKAEETFSEPVRALIGHLAADEYRAAGRCYAFGIFTAAGYHCCRAVEAVLREYYRVFTGKKDGGTETWGMLLSGLEKCSGSAEPDAKTISHIKHVKDYDRNPLSHLRAVLDETDADVLLAASKVAITAMAMEIKQKNLSAAPVLDLEVPARISAVPV